jgi:hypothetical protein
MIVRLEIEWKEVNRMGKDFLSDPIEQELMKYETEAKNIDKAEYLKWREAREKECQK